LIKVMNLVSLLIAPAVVLYSVGADKNNPLRIMISVAAVLIIAGAVAFSKRKPIAMSAGDGDGAQSENTEPEKVTA
jgi:K(+)-stimulated pyrophosphate-energized sodium pump